jgi:hypothetical protein
MPKSLKPECLCRSPARPERTRQWASADPVRPVGVTQKSEGQRGSLCFEWMGQCLVRLVSRRGWSAAKGGGGGGRAGAQRDASPGLSGGGEWSGKSST